MNPIKKLPLQSLRMNRKRSIMTILGIALSCALIVAVVGIGYQAQTRRFAAQITNPSNSLRCRRIQNGRQKRCQNIERMGRLVQRGAAIWSKVESRKSKVESPSHFPLSTRHFPLAVGRAPGSQSSVSSWPCSARARTTSRA